MLAFAAMYIYWQNWEFVIYVGVVIAVFLLLLWTNKTNEYADETLALLSLWAMMHMCGGGVYLGGTRLYDIVLLPLVGDPFYILKYDQVVHTIGFGAATLLMHDLIRPYLRNRLPGWISLAVVIVFAGMGAGAFNEVVEFATVVLFPSTGVGGYYNTALDLVCNMIGATVAGLYAVLRRK